MTSRPRYARPRHRSAVRVLVADALSRNLLCLPALPLRWTDHGWTDHGWADDGVRH